MSRMSPLVELLPWWCDGGRDVMWPWQWHAGMLAGSPCMPAGSSARTELGEEWKPLCTSITNLFYALSVPFQCKNPNALFKCTEKPIHKSVQSLPQPSSSRCAWMSRQTQRGWCPSIHVERAGWPVPPIPTLLVCKPAIKWFCNPSFVCGGCSVCEEEWPSSLEGDAELSVQGRWEKKRKPVPLHPPTYLPSFLPLCRGGELLCRPQSQAQLLCCFPDISAPSAPTESILRWADDSLQCAIIEWAKAVMAWKKTCQGKAGFTNKAGALRCSW